MKNLTERDRNTILMFNRLIREAKENKKISIAKFPETYKELWFYRDMLVRMGGEVLKNTSSHYNNPTYIPIVDEVTIPIYLDIKEKYRANRVAYRNKIKTQKTNKVKEVKEVKKDLINQSKSVNEITLFWGMIRVRKTSK